MNINKAITYSLLAHVRNSGTLIQGPMDIFTPLVKRILYILNQEKIQAGKSIIEIKNRFDSVYQIDMPLSVLKSILEKIAKDVNKQNKQNFQLYKDNSFNIKSYVFEEFEDVVQKTKLETEQIQKLFKNFCEIHSYNVKNELSIFDFIDKSKISLSKYLSGNKTKNNKEFIIEAQFVDYFKNIPSAYELIRKLYLGSILSSYIEYKAENINTTKTTELLLDTNFLISLLDLNTIEATYTCKKLIEIGLIQGYKFSVLIDTIEETQILLKMKGRDIDNYFLQAKINKQDIYNACERKKLNYNDLERIADRLETTLLNSKIITIPNTIKYNNLAKYSREYQKFLKIRNTPKAALHDATAIYYVREKRGNKKIYEFEKVNCWFVNNSTNNNLEIGYKNNNKNIKLAQTEEIKADELLNILWLSNPSVTKNVTENEIVDIGLSALVAFTLNETLPKASIIRELDDNIQKYAKEDITDQDVLLISTRITTRQLNNVQELNNLAKQDKAKFVAKLKEEAKKQKKLEEERQKKLEDSFQKSQKELEAAFQKSQEKLENVFQKLQEKENNFQLEKEQFYQKDKSRENEILQLKYELEEKLEKERKEKLDIKSMFEEKLEKERKEKLEIEKKRKEAKKEQFYSDALFKWRKNSWIMLLCCFSILCIIVFFIFYFAQWNLINATKTFKDNIFISIFFSLLNVVISGVAINSLILKYKNYSNIKAFKESLKLPEELI